MKKKWIFEALVLIVATIALAIVIFNNVVGAMDLLLSNSIYLFQMIIAILFSAVYTFTKFMRGKDLIISKKFAENARSNLTLQG